MRRKIRYYRLIWLKHDLPAGLSVFLVALPLCLGIALASGAPLYAGLLSGIIGGLVVSLISGSQLAVSGPAAGLSAIVAASIISINDYRVFLLTIVIAGIFQMLLGVFKLGVITSYFPSSVIRGMLAAIGILLISKQIPLALGYNQPDFWTDGFLSLFHTDNVTGNFINFNHNISRSTLIITCSCLMIMALFNHPRFKSLKVIPAPLMVVLAGIALNMIFKNFSVSLHPSQQVSIPSDVFGEMTFPDFSKLFSSSEIWKTGLVIGMLASLETLLCIEAIDKLDKHNRITPVNRELFAQGAGNLLCGLTGAIPMTAVVVRGAANVDAGGRTKLSAFTHGLFLLLAVVAIPSLLNLIPYASLSAILLVTGYNLTRPSLYIKIYNQGMVQFLPFLITIIMILITDLLMGVSIGLLISVYYIIQNNFKTEFKINKIRNHDIEHCNIKLNSSVTFLNKVKLRKALDEIPEYSVLTIDGSDCHFIDHDILEMISEFRNKAHDRHIELHLMNVELVDVLAH